MYSLSPALKIAVVDDDDLFRNILEKWLNYHLHSEVLTFSNGKSAWLHLQKPDSADLVISDIDMPVLDGISLLTRAKQHYPEKLFLMISGDPYNARLSIEHGADGFLGKPFSVSRLVQTVQKLSGSHAGESAQRCA
jgi:DNA-binding NtrC family response regulator